MTKRHFTIFVAVCKERSMTRAAAALYLTQPAVSQAIGELERYYGAKLFERHAKKLLLTDAGVTLLIYAKDILHLFNDAQAHLHAKSFLTLRVGANLTAGTAFIMDSLRQFYAEEPMVRVKVHISGSTTLQKLLADNDLDFALMEDAILDPHFMATPFYRDRLVVVASPKSPYAARKDLCFADIADENFLLWEQGAGVRDMFDHLLCLCSVRIDPLWESADTGVLVQAVQAGLGISILPDLLVRQQLRAGTLAELAVRDLPLERDLNLVHHRKKILSPVAVRFLEIVRESARRLAAGDSGETG